MSGDPTLESNVTPAPTVMSLADAFHDKAWETFAPKADYEQFLTGPCGVPQSYLDAWEVTEQAALIRQGRPTNGNPSLYLGTLISYLWTYTQDHDYWMRTLSVTNAVGWSLLATDEDDLRPLLNEWCQNYPHGWVYAAAGLTPFEVRADADRLPDADALRVLAALRGYMLPDPLGFDPTVAVIWVNQA